MYKQLTDQIKNAIAAGDIKANEKLPSVRELSESLKISTITIKRAYFDLENEGLIFTRAGMGSFVTEINRESLREQKLAEIRTELQRLVGTGKKFGVTADDIVQLVRQIQED
jgi:GntR family transcriptional regulator